MLGDYKVVRSEGRAFVGVNVNTTAYMQVRGGMLRVDEQRWQSGGSKLGGSNYYHVSGGQSRIFLTMSRGLLFYFIDLPTICAAKG